MACEFNKSIDCSCTASCSRHGKCCECVAHHRAMSQFPGCFFSPEGEKKYDRSWEVMLSDRS